MKRRTMSPELERKLADFLGAAVAASAFLFVLPAEKGTGDIEAASTK